jgi:hypothetical protein
MRPHFRGALLFAIALSLSAVACRTSGSGGLGAAIERGKSANADDSTRVTLRVENRSFWDQTIFAIQENGNRNRLGTVTGSLTTILTVPPNLLTGGSALRFISEPIGGGRRAATDRVYLAPGDQVTLTIPQT